MDHLRWKVAASAVNYQDEMQSFTKDLDAKFVMALGDELAKRSGQGWKAKARGGRGGGVSVENTHQKILVSMVGNYVKTVFFDGGQAQQGYSVQAGDSRRNAEDIHGFWVKEGYYMGDL